MKKTDIYDDDMEQLTSERTVGNVLLVEPKSPDFNIYTMFKIPRMGLAILGTLARNAGYNVKIIYQETTPLTYDLIMWADMIGFSIITSTAPEGYRLAHSTRILNKQRNKNIPILFGGVHATFKPEEALQYGDFVFRGEAENTFVPFLDAFNRGDDITGIPGLSRKENGRFIHNPVVTERVDMNDVPTPDWSLFVNYKPIIGIAMTSRGCPYDCSFCSVTAMLGRRYRTRSDDLIIQDLSATSSKHVFFYDDNFTADRKRTKRLLRRIIMERGITHHIRDFSAQVRVDVSKDPELLDLMKEAGFKTFYIGFESVNQKTLELYKKGQTLNESIESIREIHQRGIQIHGMFVFGSDADGKETFRETLAFVKQNKIETVQFLIITPLPGTDHYRKLDNEGRILCYEWERYDAFNTVFLPKKMSPYHLQIWTIQYMKRFYSIRRMLKNLFRGRIWLACLYAYGWFTLYLWSRNNRKKLRKLLEDSRKLFVPEIMQAPCPVRE
ncbi:MAG: B12-binding domain-containing radical SAM protein [Spirochaetales bacterium]|nr:B12-binding domain-containing radical SAM protein [Spirochaetales bacterium]